MSRADEPAVAVPRHPPGRPREFEVEVVLDAAIDAFLERGFHATSLTHLTAATGLHRGSLYAAFGDKHQLFLAALCRHNARSLEQLRADLGTGPTRVEALRRHLRRHASRAADQNRGRGCLTANTTLELLPGDSDVAAVIAEHQHQVVGHLTGFLDLARATGEIAGDRPTVQLARFLFTVVEGLWQLGRTTPDEKTLTEIADAALGAVV